MKVFGRAVLMGALACMALAAPAMAEPPPGAKVYTHQVTINPDVDNVQDMTALSGFMGCVAGGDYVEVARADCLKAYGGKLPIEFVDKTGLTNGAAIVRRVTVQNFGQLDEDARLGIERMSVLLFDQHMNVFENGQRRKLVQFAYPPVGPNGKIDPARSRAPAEPEYNDPSGKDGGE